MIDKETASVFNGIDKYFRLFHWNSGAPKTAAHEFAPSFVILTYVLGAMYNDLSSLSFIIKAGLKP